MPDLMLAAPWPPPPPRPPGSGGQTLPRLGGGRIRGSILSCRGLPSPSADPRIVLKLFYAPRFAEDRRARRRARGAAAVCSVRPCGTHRESFCSCSMRLCSSCSSLQSSHRSPVAFSLRLPLRLPHLSQPQTGATSVSACGSARCLLAAPARACRAWPVNLTGMLTTGAVDSRVAGRAPESGHYVFGPAILQGVMGVCL